ncbi:DOPA-like domain-containing protein [Roridomyces roridus]|uniref:DOPA-like domain-containing protein n=1 Tax=Roridomyces roridus TaxID=1738132 RepID=A0AAD7B6M4_9AGAR|nr:DOPA-like domain-containing protein [Roridomyces roridus]
MSTKPPTDLKTVLESEIKFRFFFLYLNSSYTLAGNGTFVVCIIVPLEFFTSRLKRVSFFDSFLSRRHCAPLSITIPLVHVDTAQDIATLSSSSLAECGTRLLVPHSSIVIFFIKFSSYLRVTPVTPNPCSLLAPTPTAPAVDYIYFHQGNAEEHHAALELRDAVLRLRRDGAFIAVPLFRQVATLFCPHPVGSYEIWVPSETFSSVFSYLCMNRGSLSILVHPITREEATSVRHLFSPSTTVPTLFYITSDHEQRNAWLGPPYPLDLTTLPIRSDELPLQYPSLKVGYSSKVPFMNLEDRAALGANVERVLLKEKDAARAPI